MKIIPTHEAKTHLSRYLKAVSAGETIIIARGQRPLAKLVPIAHHPTPRPKVGQVLDERMTVPNDALVAMSPNELVAWGL